MQWLSLTVYDTSLQRSACQPAYARAEREQVWRNERADNTVIKSDT
jgi:hypothetical protein